jgi:transketolase
MRDAMLAKLLELAEDNPSLILLTGDLGFGVFEEFEKRFPKQYYNVGIGEQNMIGLAAGLALNSKKVFVYSIGNFPTLRCLEQVRNDLCYHQLNVTLISQGGGFNYGGLGMSHHTTEDLSILRALPELTIVAPSNQSDTTNAVVQLFENHGVGYLRLEKTKVNQRSQVNTFKLGKGLTIKTGNDLGIIAIGGIVSEAIAAAEELEQQGIQCRVIDMHTLKPIDEEIITKTATETRGIITVEENNLIGGLFSTVVETLAIHGIQPKIARIGIEDCYSSIVGDQQYLRKHYQIDQKAIVRAAKHLLSNT